MASAFRLHQTETEQQAALVEKRLEAHGESPSALQNAIMKIGGKGFLLFAAVMPETPGRLAAHAYSYEAMEWAGYEMLVRFAEAAGDSETVATARTNQGQERTMMERLERGFDAAEQASHKNLPARKMDSDLGKHLNEAHALENQGHQAPPKKRRHRGRSPVGGGLSPEPRRDRKERQAARAAAGGARHEHVELEGFRSRRRRIELGLLLPDAIRTRRPSLPLSPMLSSTSRLPATSCSCARPAGIQDAETQHLCETLLASERTMVERLKSAFDSAAQATPDAVQSK